jgi:glycosyltransferase involved in cell wall biosynthesis
MNILFLTLSLITDIRNHGIYADLMRKFRDEGHSVYIVTPRERKFGKKTELVACDGVNILGVKTLNIQKTNVVEKGIGTLLIESQYKAAIKKFLKGKKFDLVLYSTPPITFTKVIRSLKRANPDIISYLLLKDIFPQNAVDIGLFGRKSLFYKFFRKKEIELYKISDYIGCMSPANVNFLLNHNDFISPDRVEVAPNSIEVFSDDRTYAEKIKERSVIRKKYGLPLEKPIFIYGGNLGKPQGVSFLIECLSALKDRGDIYFVIVGDGTEYSKISSWVVEETPQNVSLFRRLPKEDYEILVRNCDVGLIFLDHRFTIPNYPSRLLSYLVAKMPIIAATDTCSDIGPIALENGYGYWCESNNIDDFCECVAKILGSDYCAMGETGYRFLIDNYQVRNTYYSIMKRLKCSDVNC